jgi:hypothetical protein
METRARSPIAKSDDLDILSAIWILSCNDENPIITYRGLTQRLGLPEDYDVRALVQSRSELFRPGILDSRLRDWKTKMKSGKGRPGWILEIHDKAEQEKAIDAIARNDVFRNQFRVEQDAPKCGLETIDWGLRHIERLRKDAAEERQTRRGIWTSLIIPFSSLVVAVISVLGTVAVQWYSIREQAEMKRYEVGFKPKQDAYSKFMIAFTEAMTSAAARDKAAVFDQLKQMEGAFYLFEPFLTIQQRVDVHEKFAQFTSLCIEEASKPSGSPPPNTAFTDQAVQLRVHFQKQLYAYLFG